SGPRRCGPISSSANSWKSSAARSDRKMLGENTPDRAGPKPVVEVAHHDRGKDRARREFEKRSRLFAPFHDAEPQMSCDDMKPAEGSAQLGADSPTRLSLAKR